MTHPKCKTCRHFGEAPNNWDNPLNLHTCHMIAEGWEMSRWNEDTHENEIDPFFKGHLASVDDGSAYKASLNVHADFYCAMHSDLKPDIKPYSDWDYPSSMG